MDKNFSSENLQQLLQITLAKITNKELAKSEQENIWNAFQNSLDQQSNKNVDPEMLKYLFAGWFFYRGQKIIAENIATE